MFCVVETKDGDMLEVVVVPDNWLNDNEQLCYWPPVKNVVNFVKTRKEPGPGWRLYSARVIERYPTYGLAHSHLDDAQYTSNLDSDADSPAPKRSRRPPQKYQRSELHVDSDEENCAPPPRSFLPAPPSLLLANVKTTLPKKDNLSSQGQPKRPAESSIPTSSGPTLVSNESLLDAGTFELFGSAVNIIDGTDAIGDFAGATFGISVVDAIPNQPEVTLSDAAAQLNRPENRPAPEMDLLRKMAVDIACIRQSMKNVEIRLSVLETGSNQREDDSEDVLPIVPFKLFEEFTAFEEELRDNDCMGARLIRDMKLTGGETVSDFVGRNLKKIIDDTLGVTYSLWGKKNNRNFSETRTWIALKKAALTAKPLQKVNVDESKVEKATQEWFRHCGGRVKLKEAKHDGTV